MSEYLLVSASKSRPHHVLKINSAKPHDLASWTTPIQLQRKYPTTQNFDYTPATSTSSTSSLSTHRDPEKIKQDRERNAKIRQQNAAAIAPYGGAARHKQNLFKRKTRQIMLADEEDRKKKEEESVPWLLEDSEGKNAFVGSLEGGQQSEYVLFMFSDDGFRVVSADKWYRFMPTVKHKTLNIDQAEEQMSRIRKKPIRWLMQKLKAQEASQEEERDSTGQDSTIQRGGSGLSGILKKFQRSHTEDSHPGMARHRSRGGTMRPDQTNEVEEPEYDTDHSDDDEIEGVADESEMIEDEKEIRDAARKKVLAEEAWLNAEQQRLQGNVEVFGEDEDEDGVDVEAIIERRLLRGGKVAEEELETLLSRNEAKHRHASSGLDKTGKKMARLVAQKEDEPFMSDDSNPYASSDDLSSSSETEPTRPSQQNHTGQGQTLQPPSKNVVGAGSQKDSAGVGAGGNGKKRKAEKESAVKRKRPKAAAAKRKASPASGSATPSCPSTPQPAPSSLGVSAVAEAAVPTPFGKTGTPTTSSSSSRTPPVAAPPAPTATGAPHDSTLITESEIVAVLRSHPEGLTLKNLIALCRTRLRVNPKSKDIFSDVVRDVAMVVEATASTSSASAGEGGLLRLKPEFR